MLKGVKTITSGYAGGTQANPSYEAVSAELTGHAEVVQITFDPSIITLADILAVFFTSHDPTSLNRQGNDVGTQYRSAIYYSSLEQKVTIEAYIRHLTDEAIYTKPIVTEIKELSNFYPAETYHQNYYRTNPDQPYCQIVINPKVTKIKKEYAHLLNG